MLAFCFAGQTGLLIIVVTATRESAVSISRILWEHLTRLPALLRLGLMQAAGNLKAGITVRHRHWTDKSAAAGRMESTFRQ